MSKVPADELRQLRKKWLEVISGGDTHCLSHQLGQMTWDAASFRVMNEARRLASVDRNGEPELSGLVHSLIDRWYFSVQALAVRRLMDTYPLDGNRGVYSLHGLIADMKRHQKLLCRSAMFEVEGLNYDYEAVRERYQAYLRSIDYTGGSVTCVPRELHWELPERRHREIDQLAGVTEATRGPDDTMMESVLDRLLSKAETAAETLGEHVNKYVAHASTPESRMTLDTQEVRLTWGHLTTARETLGQVVNFLSVYMLGDAYLGFLPRALGDPFRHIDKPMVHSSHIPVVREAWESFELEYDRKIQQGIAECMSELTARVG